jgi:hypothetical protein
MPARQRIWRSKLWAKHGNARVIIHVIADIDSVDFRVEAVPNSGKAAIIGGGTASTILAARTAAESLAARLSMTANH